MHHCKIFFDPPPRVMKIKAQINKWGLIKLKSRGKYKQDERQPLEWEKIIANEKTDGGLIFKIYKQLMKLDGLPLRLSG